MADVETLRFPRKSHRKIVSIPKESARLAEFFGIMLGDGGINNDWQANITLNAEADSDYVGFVRQSIVELFGVPPRVMKRRDKNAIVVSLASTSIVDFLCKKGLIRGNKLRGGLSIPKWILARKAYRMACVRGLMDTDGCLILHTRKLPRKNRTYIYLSFSSASYNLLKQVAFIFDSIGIEPRFPKNNREMWVYRSRDVERYMNVVGSSNKRLQNVYKKWRDG